MISARTGTTLWNARDSDVDPAMRVGMSAGYGITSRFTLFAGMDIGWARVTRSGNNYWDSSQNTQRSASVLSVGSPIAENAPSLLSSRDVAVTPQFLTGSSQFIDYEIGLQYLHTNQKRPWVPHASIAATRRSARFNNFDSPFGEYSSSGYAGTAGVGLMYFFRSYSAVNFDYRGSIGPIKPPGGYFRSIYNANITTSRISVGLTLYSGALGCSKK